MKEITATIITYNEEDRIAQCLTSLQGVADEIIVVDSYSTDKTVEICKDFNCKITQRKFNGFGAQKQYAVSLASHSYVLSVDADEILDETMRQAIIKLKEDGFEHRIYSVSRLNFYCNKPIKHSGWHPDEPTRLFDKRYATWNLRDVNEIVIFQPTITPHLIPGQLLHYKCNSYHEYARKEESYALINSRILVKEGKKPWIITPYTKAAKAFVSTFILKLGIADGHEGKEISQVAARSAFITYRSARRNFNP